MRIGIISFPFGTNYGGNLQCYAMKSILENQGHEVKFIRYRASTISTKQLLIQNLKTYSSLRTFTTKVLTKLQYKIAIKSDYFNEDNLRLFDDFRNKYFKFTPILNSKNIGDYLNDNFDAVVVGSDQVWTDLASNDKIYFLGTDTEYNGIRIAYAACSAHKKIAKRVHSNFKPLLEKFDFLSVRDKTTSFLIESICGIKPQIVPDPTELYSFNEFLNLPQLSTTANNYVFCYILGSEIRGGYKEAFKRIRNIIGIPNLRVINIQTSYDHKLLSSVDENLKSVSPEEWIRLIAGAKAVFTDSFHATLFSMKFGIPFITYFRERVRASRLVDLKNRWSLKGVVSSAGEITDLSILNLPLLKIKDYYPSQLI